jgi:hypothetical protein
MMADSIDWGNSDEEKATGHINVIDYKDQSVVTDANRAVGYANKSVYARGRFLRGSPGELPVAIESRGGWLTYGT